MNAQVKPKTPIVDQLNEAHFALIIATDALFDLNTLFDVIRKNCVFR